MGNITPNERPSTLEIAVPLSREVTPLPVPTEPNAAMPIMQVRKEAYLSLNFQSEVRSLTAIARDLAVRSHADLSSASLADAIRGFIAALPVSRTHAAGTITEHDRNILAGTRQAALEGVRPEVREAIDFLWEVLTDDEVIRARPESIDFRLKFQELCGAVSMAASCTAATEAAANDGPAPLP